MDSLLSLINLRRNPLNRMTYSGAGLHPLPVEIWERIFSLMEELYPPSDKNFHDIYHFFSPEDEHYQRHQRDPSPLASKNRDLIHTRLSIVLVCRSWYCVGIRILLSHVIFAGRDPNKLAVSFFQTIKRSLILRAYVIQVTIDSKKAIKDINAIPEIVKLLPHLPNLAVISCPLALSRMLPPTFQPRMVFIHHGAGTHRLDGRFSIDTPRGTCFWLHCQVLSFICSEHATLSVSMNTQVVFPNLVNLRLRVTHHVVVPWILSTWVLPALTNLSILTSGNNNFYVQWILLLKRTQKTLEKLQISSNFDFNSENSPVCMPRLKELHIFYPITVFKKPKKEWHSAIEASRLGKVSIYVEGGVEYNQMCRESITSTIDLLQNDYPSIKRIRIITTDVRWKFASFILLQFVVTAKDITRWCRSGLELEIISKEEMGIYTKESFTEAEYKYWEGYQVPNNSKDTSQQKPPCSKLNIPRIKGAYCYPLSSNLCRGRCLPAIEESQFDLYWLQWRGLLFSFTGDKWKPPSTTSNLVFTNLVTLSLNVCNRRAISWAVSTWKLPSLQYLFILTSGEKSHTHTYHDGWIPLLQQTRMTLKKLKISNRLEFHDAGTITMPWLDEIHILDSSCVYLSPRTPWYRSIKAPIPRIFTHDINITQKCGDCFESSIPRNTIVRYTYPSIRKIRVIAQYGQWEISPSLMHYVAVTTGEIATWCGYGLEVEIVSRNGERLYTKESFSEDGLEYS